MQKLFFLYVAFSLQMSKNAAGSGVQVTLSINIEITKMENSPADNPPSLLVTFPKQTPLPISLIKQDGQTSSPPSAKTPRKKPDSAESKPIQYLKHIKTQINLPNPTDLASMFVSELLTFQLGDAGGKGGKGGATDGTMQKIDASPLLVNLPLNERGLICSQGNFVIHFDISIKIIASTHPEQRINSFLNPSSTDLVPFVFQVSYFEGVPQIPDAKYRSSFYKPAKCKVELFGQSFWSEEIPQSTLGSNQYSSRAPIRINCNFLSKSTQEIQALKLKIDDAVAVVTIYTRVEKDEDYEPGALPPTQAQKGVKQDVQPIKPKKTSFIKVCGKASVPLKGLLYERRLQVKAQLKPTYELIGDGLVPSEQEAAVSQQLRAPDLRVQRAPPVPDDPKKAKGAVEQPSGPSNDFTQLQRLPNAEPVGDWTSATVKLTAALTYSLNELVPPPKAEVPVVADAVATKSRPQSKTKGNAPPPAVQAKKPYFQHFEHMFIYALSTQIDAIKEILHEIATINIAFCSQVGAPEVQRQFTGDHAGTFAEQANYLASLTLNSALGKQSGAQDVVKDLSLSVITGYRFVDLQTMTLMFLEAPAQYDLLSQIQVKAKQMSLAVKEGPAIAYQSRQYADGSLLLETFALSKSFLYLTTKFSQTVKYLQPLTNLFHYDKETKSLLPLAMDLREMSIAGLGINQSEYQEIIKYYSGSIPNQHGIEQLFQLPEQQPATSPPYFSNLNSPSTISSPGSNKLRSLSNSQKIGGSSGSKIIQTDSFQLLQAIVKPIMPKRYPFTSIVDTPDMPAALIEQFEIAHKAALDNDYEAEEQQHQLALQEQEAQNNAILEQQQQFQQYCDDVANDIHSSTQLKSTTMIKKALLGRQRFHYSGQLLNQQNIRYRISEFNARKPLPQMRSIRKKEENSLPEDQAEPERQETNENVQEEKQEGEVEVSLQQSPERPQSGKSTKSQKSTKTKQ